MADIDDDAPPPPSTVEELFYVYAKVNSLPQYTTNEVHDTIVLSQIDMWLEKAELLKKFISLTDTGMEYMRFKKWRLNYEEFLEFIESLCKKRGLDKEYVMEKLLAAGVPPPTENVIIK